MYVHICGEPPSVYMGILIYKFTMYVYACVYIYIYIYIVKCLFSFCFLVKTKKPIILYSKSPNEP